MDSKRIEDIERLLQKMREENMQYRENKQNLYTKPIENDEDEEENSLPSRYREAIPEKSKRSSESIEENSEDDYSDEESTQKIKKRLDELKNRKNKLGPPLRVKEDQERPKIPVSRPTTAKIIPSYIPSPQIKRKKNDPVALYQQRQKGWKSNTFLRSNTSNNREGRKLNLVPSNHAKDFEITKKKTVHGHTKTYTAPHEKRRDDIRFQTRVKMMNGPET
jgi:hypothetical protein